MGTTLLFLDQCMLMFFRINDLVSVMWPFHLFITS